MLTRRRLQLSHPQALPEGAVLKRQTLADSLLAEQLLDTARAEAQVLLADARKAAERVREEARAEVWRQGDALLADWQAQRVRMWQHIVDTGQALISQAWQQLLGELDDAQRTQAVLRQLCAASPADEPGVLYCHPDELAAATAHLQQAQAAWTLRGDPQMAAQSLCLRTEQGEFSLDWQALSTQLGPAAPDAGQ